MPSPSTSTAWKIIPQLPSSNIPATVAFYTETLGFTLGGTYTHAAPSPGTAGTAGASETTPAPPLTFASVYLGQKAEANIYFHLAPHPSPQHQAPSDIATVSSTTSAPTSDTGEPPSGPGRVMIALKGEELDLYYELLRAEGRVQIVRPVEDTAWGYRQFTVVDEDGNWLSFFKFMDEGDDAE